MNKPTTLESLYTAAELDLMVIRHTEGRVTLPAKMLRAVKAEIASRARR
jgi:hypothetical protein